MRFKVLPSAEVISQAPIAPVSDCLVGHDASVLLQTCNHKKNNMNKLQDYMLPEVYCGRCQAPRV